MYWTYHASSAPLIQLPEWRVPPFEDPDVEEVFTYFANQSTGTPTSLTAAPLYNGGSFSISASNDWGVQGSAVVALRIKDLNAGNARLSTSYSVGTGNTDAVTFICKGHRPYFQAGLYNGTFGSPTGYITFNMSRYIVGYWTDASLPTVTVRSASGSVTTYTGSPIGNNNGTPSAGYDPSLSVQTVGITIGGVSTGDPDYCKIFVNGAHIQSIAYQGAYAWDSSTAALGTITAAVPQEGETSAVFLGVGRMSDFGHYAAHSWFESVNLGT
jgi:hypothetical protein